MEGSEAERDSFAKVPDPGNGRAGNGTKGTNSTLPLNLPVLPGEAVKHSTILQTLLDFDSTFITHLSFVGGFLQTPTWENAWLKDCVLRSLL